MNKILLVQYLYFKYVEIRQKNIKRKHKQINKSKQTKKLTANKWPSQNSDLGA